MKQIYLCFILFTCLLMPAISNDIKFRHISGRNGLISNTVNAITQDSDGFMWFGTQEGLCRFDGYEFVDFVHTSGDKATLSNNVISCLVEDDKRNLWIGTRNGINKLNLDSYEIERITIWKDSLVTLPIQSLLTTSNNELYFGVDYKGLYKLDLETGNVKNFNSGSSNQSSINISTLYSLLEDKSKGIWIGTDEGLFLLNTATEVFTPILQNEQITELSFSPDSSINVGIVVHGNYYYKLQRNGTLNKVHIPLYATGKDMIPFETKDGNTWVAIRDKGIYYSNDKEDVYENLLFQKHQLSGLNSNTISDIYEDRAGNVWLGTHDSGINMHEKNSKAFLHVQDNFKDDGLRNNRVRSVMQDSEGDIWVGTKINGTLAKLDRQSLTFTHYEHDPNDPTSLCNDLILCLEEDKPGYLWIGTSNGLSYFNKKTGCSTTLNHDPTDSNSLKSNNIYSLLKDGDKLYIGHQIHGIDIYNTKTKRFKNYNYSNAKGSLSDNRVRAFFKSSTGQIWIATSNGLNLFDEATEKFTQFFHNPDDNQSISNNSIVCFHEDANGNLWVGTRWGINKMNTKTNTFERFTAEDGLASNSIKGILGDAKGNIWISTSNGLSKYNPKTDSFKNYTSPDGLQSNEFTEFAYCHTRNGELLLGGDNGLTIFHPDQIFDNKTIPEVHLTDFKLFNESINYKDTNSPLSNHINSCEEIVLNYKQSVITIDYVGLNYTSPSKNQFAYRLDGFDAKQTEWNYVGSQRSATYTNLRPGNYVFRVKAANNDGYWNEKGKSIKIKVLPPPWLSWWAYILYAIIFLGLIFILRQYTIKRVKEEKQRENDQQNLRFFMNVSHEFRTPITLILNPIKKLAESLSSEKDKETLESIHQSANKLLHLVNQLMDYRRADLGHSHLNLAKQNIVAFSESIFEQFYSIGESKNINLKFYASEKEIEHLFDADKYEKILSNLLSNALKFTNKGGEVKLSISSGSSFIGRPKQSEYVEICVEDTGKGMNQKQLKRVFDRYYSDDVNQSGIGIGLNYTKTLVELHKGSITAESVEGEGTKFVVRLPLKVSYTNASHTETILSKGEEQFNTSHLESLKYDLATSDITSVNDEESEKKSTKLPLLLIVEDNRKLRIQLKDELRGQYQIKEAVNGKDGLDKAKEFYPDLVISDIMMPVMDGIEMCASLKSNIDTAHIPIILLSAKSLIEHKIQGLQTGADDYISKPFSMPLLKVRLANLLETRIKLKEKYATTSINVPANNFTTNNLDEVFLDKITKIVIDHLGTPDFTQQQLEEKMSMSRSGLYKKVNSLTGCSTSIFIRNIKLKHAAELLLSGQYPIKEIAYLTGFNSPSYFNTSFKKLFGLTPLQYVSEHSAMSENKDIKDVKEE